MAKILFTTDRLDAVCREMQKEHKNSTGFDKMTPEAAQTWLAINGEALCHRLNGGIDPEEDPVVLCGLDTEKAALKMCIGQTNRNEDFIL